MRSAHVLPEAEIVFRCLSFEDCQQETWQRNIWILRE